MFTETVTFCEDPECTGYGIWFSADLEKCPDCLKPTAHQNLLACSCGQIVYPAYKHCRQCGASREEIAAS